MRDYSKLQEEKQTRLTVPIVDDLPDPLNIGEIVYKNDPHAPGLYIYKGNKRWVLIFAQTNNLFEQHIAEPDQKIFNLANSYPTNGYSLNVYVDRKRLDKSQFAELSKNIVAIKEDGLLKGGELVEFQLFNVNTEIIHDTVTRHVTYK